jgi:hypothetical protein
MEQSGKIKVRGNIRIEHSSGKVWESKNFVVNQGVHFVGDILGGASTGTIYRMAIGDGGIDGFGNRILPDDTWYLKTGLVSPRYSNDLSSPCVVTHDGQTTSLYFNHVFTGADHTGAMTHASEVALIIGGGSSGILEGNNAIIMPNIVGPPAEVNYMFAYRTFEELSLTSGDRTETITVHWTILLENG